LTHPAAELLDVLREMGVDVRVDRIVTTAVRRDCARVEALLSRDLESRTLDLGSSGRRNASARLLRRGCAAREDSRGYRDGADEAPKSVRCCRTAWIRHDSLLAKRETVKDHRSQCPRSQRRLAGLTRVSIHRTKPP
jgi:hypothetical protein